jgi:hypothetical protein
LAKTNLQHLGAAAAINVLRIGDWLAERVREGTRVPAFVRLITSTASA